MMRINDISRMSRLLAGMVFCFLLTGCDEQPPDIDDMLPTETAEETAGDALLIKDLKFSDDNKEIQLSVHVQHDIGDHDLLDSSKVAFKLLQQVQILPGEFRDESQPVITKVTNPSRDSFRELDMKILLIVDLSMPQHVIDEELSAVREIRSQLGHDQRGVYIAFMQGENISESYETTDYIVDNYFQHRDPSYIYLYRSILTKLAEFTDESTTLGSARHKVMIIMSGGKTYDNDMPVDPKHFALQQALTDRVPLLKGKVWVYYANFSPSDINMETPPLTPPLQGRGVLGGFAGNDTNILQYFCKDTNGLYQSSFNWQEMETDLLSDFHIDLSNFNITLDNPDGKLFQGCLHKLQVEFYDKATGQLIAKGTTKFSLGSPYHPVIIRDATMSEVIISGILTTLTILLIVWLIFQLIEPYVRYKFFEHKYVIRYSGNAMSANDKPVSESCYLCKGPFEKGDRIVVKCSHTMHKECWDENEYHCPEHGRHCKEGSHYYNRHNLLDRRNALFYLKWMIIAVFAGFTAWIVFVNHDHSNSISIVEYIHKTYHDITSTKDEGGFMTFVHNSYLNELPGFGQAAGFILTMFFSAFTINRRKWISRVAEVLTRAFIAGLVGYLCCLLGCIISTVMHLESNTLLVDWIPWALMSTVIMLASTIKTRTQHRKSILLACCVMTLLTVAIWAYIYFNSFASYRQSLLIGFILYAIAMGVCIARVTPRSERFFLHVEGAIKEMDIALYKWIRTAPNRPVTIGKSVDCSIQLSWDVIGQVAPVHAEIRKHLDSIRLTALEDGVLLNNKPLQPGKEIWLLNGRKFTIGNTTFTYIEKDL